MFEHHIYMDTLYLIQLLIWIYFEWMPNNGLYVWIDEPKSIKNKSLIKLAPGVEKVC